MDRDREMGGGRDRDVVKIHGRRAAEAVWARRPEDVVRAYVDRDARAELSEMLRALASRRIAYRLVPADELERVAESRHHEGLCLLVRPAETPSLETWASGLGPSALALVLDGVVNPHNLGALVRTAAHFGASAVVVDGNLPRPGAYARVAEGGTEHVPVIGAESSAEVLEAMKSHGFTVVGARQSAGGSLFETKLGRRTALVLGSERHGLSPEVEAVLDLEVAIPGSGAVESLNVSVAGAVMMAEWARQRSEVQSRRRRP